MFKGVLLGTKGLGVGRGGLDDHLAVAITQALRCEEKIALNDPRLVPATSEASQTSTWWLSITQDIKKANSLMARCAKTNSQTSSGALN